MVPTGAIACTEIYPILPKLRPNTHLLVGTVVDYVNIDVERKDHGNIDHFGGVVVFVDDPIVNPIGETEYEVYPMGIGSDCERSGYRIDAIREQYKVDTQVWIAARPFHFSTGESRSHVLLEVYRSGGMWPVTSEMADFDLRRFDYKYHRKITKREEEFLGIIRGPGYGQFAYLVSLSQLRASTNDVDRIDMLTRLARYRWLFDFDYSELVDGYVEDGRERMKLKDKYWRWRAR